MVGGKKGAQEFMMQTVRQSVRLSWLFSVVPAFVRVGVLVAATVAPAVVHAQSADRVLTTEGIVSGKVVSVSASDVDVEDRNGETKKIPIDKVREVQFEGEPPAAIGAIDTLEGTGGRCDQRTRQGQRRGSRRSRGVGARRTAIREGCGGRSSRSRVAVI